METEGNLRAEPRLHCLEQDRGTTAARNEQKNDGKPRKIIKKHYYDLTKIEVESLRKKLFYAKQKNERGVIMRTLGSMIQCERDVVIWKDKKTGEMIFQSFTCDKKFCPKCGIEWSRKLQTGVKQSAEKIPFREMRHVVLTCKNCSKEKLDETIKLLYSAFREWRNQGRRIKGGGYWINVEGLCWKLEIDKKTKKEFHPHLHVLIHAKGGLDLRKGSRGREAWVRVCRTKGIESNHASGIYITQITSDNAEREIAKYAAKPLQIKAMDSDTLLALISSTYKKRFCGSSGSLQCSTSKPRNEESKYEQLGSLSVIYHDPDSFKGNVEMAVQGLSWWLSFKENLWDKLPDGIVNMAREERENRRAK